MRRKTSVWPTISIVLIFLMIIAVPSFAFFDEIGSGAGDFFDGAGEGADDFFDSVGEGAGDYFDDTGDGAGDYFDGVGGGSEDYFDGIGTGPEAEFDGLDDTDDGFDDFPTGIPGDDSGIEFPPTTQPDPENTPKFPPKNAVMDITIKDSKDSVEPGTVFTYTINYANGGFVDAKDVSLAVMYDDKTGYNSASPKPTEGIDRWTIGKVLPQKGGTVKIDVVVRGNAKDGDVIVFKANLKYVDSATGKLQDVSATETTRIRIAPQPAPQPEPSPPTKLEEGVSLKILSTKFPFTATAGSTVPIYLRIENNGNEKLENTKITIINQELAIRTSTGPFDLGKGRSASKMLLLKIPENTPEGTYMLRFTVSSNSQIRRVIYRELEII
ncbi:MAG: hypothetical protein QW666_03985 [Candidatus Woesearchaeota archaeon]